MTNDSHALNPASRSSRYLAAQRHLGPASDALHRDASIQLDSTSNKSIPAPSDQVGCSQPYTISKHWDASSIKQATEGTRGVCHGMANRSASSALAAAMMAIAWNVVAAWTLACWKPFQIFLVSSLLAQSSVVAYGPPPITLIKRDLSAFSPMASCAAEVSSNFEDMSDVYRIFATARADVQAVQYQKIGCPDPAPPTCNPDNTAVGQPADPALQHNISLMHHNMPNRTVCGLEEELRTECVLWDSTCTGDLKNATTRFFQYHGTRDFLLQLNISDNNPNAQGDPFALDAYNLREPFNTPTILEQYRKMWEWSRSDSCDKLFNQAADDSDKRFSAAGYTSGTSLLGHVPGNGRGFCCGTGGVRAGNVDIYYWPDPDADTSCLDVVGGDPHPIDYGATTASDGTKYWGCLSTGRTSSWIETTASIVSIQDLGVEFKEYVTFLDDYSACREISTPSRSPLSSFRTTAPVSATVHSLRLPSGGLYPNATRPTTVVSGFFTFTSPSIYAHFTNIKAWDSCHTTLISSTMMSFTDGELSTLAGITRTKGSLVTEGTTNYYWTGYSVSTRVFNFKDLPCPPAGVANAQLYQAHPGEPYRPQIIMPDKLRRINTWFAHLTDHFFTGFDPPHTLAPQPTFGADPDLPQDQGGPVAVPAGIASPAMAKPTPTDQAKAAAEAMVPATPAESGTTKDPGAKARPESGDQDPAVLGDVAAGNKAPDKTSSSMASKTSDASQPAAGAQKPSVEKQVGLSPWQEPLQEQKPQQSQQQQPQQQPQQQQPQNPTGGPDVNPVAQKSALAQGQTPASNQNAKPADDQPQGQQNSQHTNPEISGGTGTQKSNAQAAGDNADQQIAPQSGDPKVQQLNQQASQIPNQTPNQQANQQSSQQNIIAVNQEIPAKIAGNPDPAAGTAGQSPAGQPQIPQQPAKASSIPTNIQNSPVNNVQPVINGQQAVPQGQPVGKTGSQPQDSPQSQVQPAVNGLPAASSQQNAAQPAPNGQAVNQVQKSQGGQTQVSPGGLQRPPGQPSDAPNGVQSLPFGQPVVAQAGGSAIPQGAGSAATQNGQQPAFEPGSPPGQETPGQQTGSTTGAGATDQGQSPVEAALNGLKSGTSGSLNSNSGDTSPVGHAEGNGGAVATPNSRNNFNTASAIVSSKGKSEEPKIVTIAGYDMKPLTGAISIEGKTLSVGDPAITGRGSDIISLATDGLTIGSVTIMRTDAESAQSAANVSRTATANSSTTTAPVNTTTILQSLRMTVPSATRPPVSSSARAVTSSQTAKAEAAVSVQSTSMLAMSFLVFAAGFLIL